MITTSDTIILNAGDIVCYDAPDIRVVPENQSDNSKIKCLLQVINPGHGVVVGEGYVTLDASTVDGQTTLASSYTTKFQNAVEKSVKAYLEGVNGSATFSIT